jgi:hypothetical protein
MLIAVILQGGAEGNTLSVFNPATGSGMVATAAVCLPIRGLIWPVPDPPYNLWPYLLAAWVLIGLVILFVISRRRPELIEAMGAAFSEAGVDEPDTAQEDVRRRKDRDAAESRDTIE